jgi:DNA-binding transcriptional LysR family regulator
MDDLDLNLLVALDALLTEGSVTRAALRLGLSASAMSRTLARLRTATRDPLLVRAGRGLVPTPRATALRGQVHELVRDARVALSPVSDTLDIDSLERTFTVRASEGFVELFSAKLVAAVVQCAPHVRLRFAPKPAKEVLSLREGQIDLEIGTPGTHAAELRARWLFRDRFIGAARDGHPLLEGPMTAERYAACKHVVASRKALVAGPVDEALEALGLRREIVAIVPGFPDALRIARESDLIALVPGSCFGPAATPMPGLSGFDLPVRTTDIEVYAMWHPRVDADPAHRWLRDTVAGVCSAWREA